MDHKTKLAVVAIAATTVLVASRLISKSILSKRPSNIELALRELHAFFPQAQLGIDEQILTKFGTSWGSMAPSSPPTIVVFVLTTAEVVKVVKIATKYGIVIIPVGGRTSLEGQFSCCSPPAAPKSEWKSSTRPTIHLSLERMNKVIKIYEQDQQAIVEAGVGWQSLNAHLESLNIPLFFPIDPGPGALFGGMCSVAGSGTNAVSYGTMKGEWIMNIEVILMNGEVLNTRGSTSRARKSTTGWDTMRLFLGSEGTLGVSPFSFLAIARERESVLSFMLNKSTQ